MGNQATAIARASNLIQFFPKEQSSLEQLLDLCEKLREDNKVTG
jgi:hypothetical protein